MGGSTRLKSAQDGWELGVNLGLVRVFTINRGPMARRAGLPAETTPPAWLAECSPVVPNLAQPLSSETIEYKIAGIAAA